MGWISSKWLRIKNNGSVVESTRMRIGHVLIELCRLIEYILRQRSTE
jgi:hypothetical protein